MFTFQNEPPAYFDFDHKEWSFVFLYTKKINFELKTNYSFFYLGHYWCNIFKMI